MDIEAYLILNLALIIVVAVSVVGMAISNKRELREAWKQYRELHTRHSATAAQLNQALDDLHRAHAALDGMTAMLKREPRIGVSPNGQTP